MPVEVAVKDDEDHRAVGRLIDYIDTGGNGPVLVLLHGLLEEARILRRADADHVVRFYDNGETVTGTTYFVMSYADRGTVADLLDDRRPPSRSRSRSFARPRSGCRCCTAAASSTATSGRRTCCSDPAPTAAPKCWSPTSGSPRPPPVRPG